MLHFPIARWATVARLLTGVVLLAASSEAGAADPVIYQCLVTAEDEVRVPAQEPGVLVELNVDEGAVVTKGQVLGRIDDSERQMQKRLALIEQQAAQEQAQNDINVRYAEAAAKVAEVEYEQALDANRRVAGTFPAAEVRRLKLAWSRSVLQIEQANLEQRLAVFTAKTRGAEVEAADTNIARRQITSTIDGQVVALFTHSGEWVTPGEPVLRLVRFDELRVQGFVKAAEFDPGEIANREVTVEFKLARDRKVKLPGVIAHVSPLVQSGGEYRVWAKVKNEQQNGHWVLRPGLTPQMTIHVSRPPRPPQAE